MIDISALKMGDLITPNSQHEAVYRGIVIQIKETNTNRLHRFKGVVVKSDYPKQPVGKEWIGEVRDWYDPYEGPPIEGPPITLPEGDRLSLISD